MEHYFCNGNEDKAKDLKFTPTKFVRAIDQKWKKLLAILQHLRTLVSSAMLPNLAHQVGSTGPSSIFVWQAYFTLCLQHLKI
jgi:hypothetical protein